MLASLFRSGAVTVEAPASLVDDQLTPEEQAYVRAAVPRRRAEFGTARVLARRALARLGIAGVSLVPREDRSPTWPEGIVGSITHTEGYCAVVVDRSPPMRSLGLDVETLRALDDGMIHLILTPRERAWVAAHGRASRDELALLLFSAKEAYYKCQYPLSSTFLGHQDVEIEIDERAGCFEVTAVAQRLPAPLARLTGRFAFASNRVLCGVELHERVEGDGRRRSSSSPGDGPLSCDGPASTLE